MIGPLRNENQCTPLVWPLLFLVEPRAVYVLYEVHGGRKISIELSWRPTSSSPSPQTQQPQMSRFSRPDDERFRHPSGFCVSFDRTLPHTGFVSITRRRRQNERRRVIFPVSAAFATDRGDPKALTETVTRNRRRRK